MKQMINLALTSEYNFQETLAHVKDLVSSQPSVVGVADSNNTFSHYKVFRECSSQGKKAIYGVRLMVVKSPEERIPPRGQFGPTYILLAKNHDGLKEIYRLVQRSTECFYYRAHVGLVDIWRLSDNVIVISENFEIDERIDYIGISFNTPKKIRERTDIPHVALQCMKYIRPEDREAYELFAGQKANSSTFPGHILTTEEWMSYFNDEEAVENTHVIADQCNCELATARPVKYLGQETLEKLCIEGASELGIDLEDPVYKERYLREMSLIKQKDFVDYFLIVAEMVNGARETMLVGPSRGSAAGSLVCYLAGITTIDPIKWNLLFDRFIDINRNDMPDIDIDFPDKKRASVVKALVNRNGEERVKHIATISKMKFKSALAQAAKGLGIPPWEVEDVSVAVARHSSGDIRFATNKSGIELAFTETEVGKEFVKKHPKMELAIKIEDHARHTGVHAAGMMVSRDDLINFAGVNERDKTFMMDHKDAEASGLLKMDCLGLTTLSVLENVAEIVGFEYSDYYNLPLDDDNVFSIFRDMRLNGIFQFEGYALQNLCRSIKVGQFEDIVAITALARPGPLHGGAAKMFSEIHTGKEKISWILDHEIAKKITKNTLGTIVYQEQLMEICKDIGNMDWEQVNEIRRGASKKKGKEYFNQFREVFLEGAQSHGISLEDASVAWEAMLTFGAYGFNRSHAVAYGMISYWTAWAKYYHPLEFAVASLNNSGSVDSAIKLLRELKEKDGIQYVPVDPDLSDVEWSVHDGKLLGGLTNIKGIGTATARKIIKCRNNNELPPPSVIKKLARCETEFDILNPCEHYWRGLYEVPKIYGLAEAPARIKEISRKGTYTFIGKLIKKNVRDLNELVNVQKRGGEVLTEHTSEMNLTFEDDTDVMMCRISRKSFDRMAPDIIEHGREGEDYYLVKGDIISDEIRFIFIKEIFRLGDGINETIEDFG